MAFDAVAAKSLTYAHLRALGLSRREIRRQLAAGGLVRLRRGKYAAAGLDEVFRRAAELGGRLDCVSLLRCLGVFVLGTSSLHLQMSRGASRCPPAPQGVVRHWRESVAVEGDLAADLVEALAQSCRCQKPREAIATLDSAWHLGLVDAVDIAAVFARLPAQYQVLRSHLDPRSEAGTETLVRLMLRGLGCSVDLQVDIPGVGRVDLVVDGWLIVECDSRAHHGTEKDQLRDRQRDLEAAKQGYVTLRLLAKDILFHPEEVVAALRGVVDSRYAR